MDFVESLLGGLHLDFLAHLPRALQALHRDGRIAGDAEDAPSMLMTALR
jgi:hypothetical protein